jgi:hypothetical protein
MVRYLGERARREQLINLVPVQASADAVNLPSRLMLRSSWTLITTSATEPNISPN